MDNVYNQEEFERNSIQSVPAGYIDGAANDLFRFLGSFWRNIHEGTGFVRGLQNARGIKLAQFYLDLIESLKLQDRNGAPVFHRELWKPLVIRLSSRDKTTANVVKTGDSVELAEEGLQPSGEFEGYEIEIGKMAKARDYVAYPVHEDIVSISGIADNIVSPKTVLKAGVDFEYRDGAVIFPKDRDPFGKGSGFSPYDVVDDDVDAKPDVELVLWASDALIDRNYISDHVSYALGIDCPSNDIAKRIVNAGWDALNCGLTPELIRSLLAAMANIPVIQEPEETVIKISVEDDCKTVKTDRHAYTVSPKANLRKSVKLGSVLHRGEFLDESIKVYPFLNNIESVRDNYEYGDGIEEDIPVIDIPGSILSTGSANGLFVEWSRTPLVFNGIDSRGHRKLSFKMGGLEEDVEKFWEDTWQRAEEEGIDIEPMFDVDADGKVSPAEFFLKYFIGGNTIVVTIDRNQLDDASMLRNPMFFGLLGSAVPSGSRMFFIEHENDASEDYDFAAEAEDEADEFAQMEASDDYGYEDEDEYDDYSDLPGMKGRRIPSYEDEVQIKFVRSIKRREERTGGLE